MDINPLASNVLDDGMKSRPKLTRAQVKSPAAARPLEYEHAELREDFSFSTSPPKRLGYFFIGGSILIMVTMVLGVRARGINWYAASVTIAFMLFLLVVGFKILRQARPALEDDDEHSRG